MIRSRNISPGWTKQLGIQASVCFLIAALCFPIKGAAQELSDIPGAFASIGIGAHTAGMGFTGSAVNQGASAAAWNPASIYPSEGLETMLSYVDQLGLMEYGHFSLAVPLSKNRLGMAISAEYSGDESFNEASVQLLVAQRISFLWVGVGVGYRKATFGKNSLSRGDYSLFSDEEITEGLAQQVSGNASGYHFNAGIRMHLSQDLVVGLVAKNILAPLSWASYATSRPGEFTYNESVPMEWSTGIRYQLSRKLAGSMEWVPTLGMSSISRVGIGIEFQPVQSIALRTGRLVFQDGLSNEVTTLGFGIKTPEQFGIHLKVDYAYILGSIANTQQLSLTVGL